MTDDQQPSIAARLVGAGLCGGGAYAALAFGPWHAPHPISLAAAVLAALVGAMFGPKAVEMVFHIF